MREFEVRGSLWARYEVRTTEAFDVSAERGQEAPGRVWDLGSRGYLFHRADESVPFDQGPNRVLATNYLRSEMRGIPMVPPAQAAVAIDDPNLLDVGPNGFIEGGSGPGIAYPNTGAMPALPAGQVTGTPATSGILAFDSDAKSVFRMHMESLESVADFVVRDFRPPGLDHAHSSTSDHLFGGTGGDGGALAPQEPEESSVSTWNWWNSLTSVSASETDSGGDWAAVLIDSPSTSTSQGLARSGNAHGLAARELFWARGTLNYAPGVGKHRRRSPNDKLRDKALIIDRDLTLDANNSLNGRALVVVQGDLTVAADNLTRLKGILYVNGDADIEGDFELCGMLIVRGDPAHGPRRCPLQDRVRRERDPHAQALARALPRQPRDPPRLGTLKRWA